MSRARSALATLFLLDLPRQPFGAGFPARLAKAGSGEVVPHGVRGWAATAPSSSSAVAAPTAQ